MRDVLERMVDAAGAPAGLFAPWVDAAVAGGPTPPSGPLRFDVLIGSRPATFGITLFDHGDGRAVQVARRTAPSALRDALDTVLEGPEARHVGLRWTPAGSVLKIYRTGGAMTGVDLDVRGPHRRRVYRRVTAPASIAHAGLTGYSHTIEARLDPDAARDGVGKTTTAIIFGPHAPSGALIEAARALHPGTDWAPPPALLVPAARAAALELDRWDDGRERFDALITLA